MALQRKTTRSVKPGTQRVQKPTTSAHRAQRAPSGGGEPKSNNQMLIIGGAAGGVLLLIVVGFLMMGGKEEPKKEKKPAKVEETKPLDVSGLVARGEKNCADGVAIMKGVLSNWSESLPDDKRTSMVTKLREGFDLYHKGMEDINEANTKSNGKQGFMNSSYGDTVMAAKKIIQGNK